MRFPCAVLGATGTVGQRFLRHLSDHPWFEPVHLAASSHSAGKRYGDVVSWIEPTACPQALLDSVVADTRPVEGLIAFSALGGDEAGAIEDAWRDAGALVISNASAHRMDADVPLLVPEINGSHGAALCASQPGAGALICQPNCTTTGLVLALAPLVEAFALRHVGVTSLQASSGAGLGGPTFLELVDNVLPHIPGEAEKLAEEPPKILGQLDGDRVEPRELDVEATCTRVPLLEGHLLCLQLEFEQEIGAGPLLEALESWRGYPNVAGLPSAPERPVLVHRDPRALQPRLCRDLGDGMSVSVGDLRGFGRRWRLQALVHNTERGAAKGALLSAELAVREGWHSSWRQTSR